MTKEKAVSHFIQSEGRQTATGARLPARFRSHPLSRLAVAVALATPTLDTVAQSEGEGPLLEEVLVTAQKREQRLLDVPLSVSAFTQDTLTDIGANQLADFLQSSPGIGIIDNNSGTQNIQIRGINSTFGNAPVGYYLDELPFSLIGNTQVPDVRTYDLARVEVLRGPQGTLYGDGSIGGTIRMLTHEPDLDEFAARIDVAGMSTKDGEDSFRAQGMLNAPIAEGKAGLRLVATWEDFGGWVDNSLTGVEDQNEREIDTYRGKFRWQPSDNLDVVLSAWHSSQDATGDANSLEDRTSPFPASVIETEYDLYSATIRYSFENFDLISATSLMDYSSDSLTFLADGSEFLDDTTQDVITEELRLSSTGDGNFRWTAGLFIRQTERDTLTELPAFFFTQDLAFESNAFAVFGELTWTLLDDRLDLTLGMRYFEDDLEFDEVLDPFLLGIIQSVDPDFTGAVSETFDTTNPRFNAAYRLNENWNVYANVAKGFRTGQAQPGISLGLAVLNGVEIPAGIEPEELWSYEIGAKGSFWGGRATLEAAAFFNDWEDLQVAVVVTPQVRALVNGGTAETRGLEAALTLAPVENLVIRLSGGYTDAEFTESVDGINISDGDRVPNVPETTLAASATYRWNVGSGLQGFAYGGAQYASERSDTLNFALDGDATTRIDARVGVEADRWNAYLFVENLTDEDGAITPLIPGLMGSATRMRPATYGLQLGLQF
ncbi:MAG: TonB-dependent receptor [Pseudomonadota bacterium]